jgi:hypothetical protein
MSTSFGYLSVLFFFDICQHFELNEVNNGMFYFLNKKERNFEDINTYIILVLFLLMNKKRSIALNLKQKKNAFLLLLICLHT